MTPRVDDDPSLGAMLHGLDESAQTESELTRRLEMLAQPEILATLQGLASAVFPSGTGLLEQLSWEATTTPPDIPTAIVPADGHQPATDEAKLRAAELRYRTLVEQIPAVTFMAVLGEGKNEVYVSPHIESLLGFTQREWLENPILWYQQIHPDDRAMLIQEFARGIHTGGPFRSECRLFTRDRRLVWVRGEARLIKDEYGRPHFLQGVAFDITESKKVQEQTIRRTEERYRDLVEGLGAIFWEADARTGRFMFVSHGAERLLGFSPRLWLNDPGFWLSRVVPGDREQVTQAWRQTLRERRDQEIEFRALTADDRIVWLHNRIHFPSGDIGDDRLLGVIIDITDRKLGEDELARLYDVAEAARQASEAANRVKDEFLATMSHELRTPVNAVLGWSGILETRAGGQQMQERALTAIKRAAQAQAHIIDDLLDVSRIITGKLDLEITRVDLAAVVDAALETVKLAADAKHIRMPTYIVRPTYVLGDVGRLRQVLSNLLTNAVKFTPNEGQIEVRVEVVGRTARAQVIDSGQGIDPSFLPYVFDRFRQADGSSTRKHGGLGLGLAIVRHLTELHGGRVTAESAGKGHGATFTVDLPLDTHDEARAGNGAQTRKDSGDAKDALVRARVLVVDDDPDSLDVLVAFLARAGAEVSSAASAGDALRLLKRRRFDLLVCDIAMPEQDGFELIRQVREERTWNQNIPAAAVTAYARDEDRARALAEGFQDHIAKPIDIDDALARMGRLLKTHRANHAGERRD